MLHALLPAAALLTHNSAAKVEPKTNSTANVAVAQVTDATMPASPSQNLIADGQSYP